VKFDNVHSYSLTAVMALASFEGFVIFVLVLCMCVKKNKVG